MKKPKFRLGQAIKWLNNPEKSPHSRIKGKIVGLETSIIEFINEPKKTIEYTYQIFDGYSSSSWVEEKDVFK